MKIKAFVFVLAADFDCMNKDNERLRQFRFCSFTFLQAFCELKMSYIPEMFLYLVQYSHTKLLRRLLSFPNFFAAQKPCPSNFVQHCCVTGLSYAVTISSPGFHRLCSQATEPLTAKPEKLLARDWGRDSCSSDEKDRGLLLAARRGGVVGRKTVPGYGEEILPT